MATTLLGRERVGSATLSSNKSSFEYKETYDFLVMSDDIENEAYWDVITTPGLPLVFVTDYNGLRCTSKSASRDSGHAGLWHVKCEFSSETVGQEPDEDPDPTTWVPIWSGTIETYDKVLWKDSTGAAYVNYAGDQFPDPMIIKKPIVVFEFSQYESGGLSVSTIAARNDKVNDATFKGFSTRTLKVNVKAFTKGRYFNYPATKVDYVVAYDSNQWILEPYQIGYEYYEAGEIKQSPTLVYLDTDGTIADPRPATPLTKTFYPYTEISFSSFIR